MIGAPALHAGARMEIDETEPNADRASHERRASSSSVPERPVKDERTPGDGPLRPSVTDEPGGGGVTQGEIRLPRE